MKLLLAALFVAFLICAVLVIFFQMRYGHLTVPDSETAALGTPSPVAIKCRRMAVGCAVCAAIFLVAACAVGALLR